MSFRITYHGPSEIVLGHPAATIAVFPVHTAERQQQIEQTFGIHFGYSAVGSYVRVFDAPDGHIRFATSDCGYDMRRTP